MPFALNDFHDFVRLLAEHPEWRTELRRLVLSDELLALPDLVRELVAAQGRAEERLSRLEEAHVRLETAVAALAEAQRRTEELVQALIHRVDRLEVQVGSLRGDSLERRYREHAGGYFGSLLRQVRVVSDEGLDAMLAAGTLDEAEELDVRKADLIVRGQRRSDGQEIYLVVEVSAGIGPGDVDRAVRRATALGKVRPAMAVVAGERLTPKAKELAMAKGVWQVLDGRVVAPQAP